MKRVRIESTGETNGGSTKIFDADSGEQIRNVRSITFRAAAGEIPTVTIELAGIGTEVIATGAFREYAVEEIKQS